MNVKILNTILAVQLITVLTLSTVGCRKENTTETTENNKVANSEQSTSMILEFEKLKGRWLRPDGGYVLELRELLPDNKVTAAYFNPGPINVGEAKIYQENGFTKVFVKLQDQNYPGSTYTLIYDVENDKLTGIYYQATYQQQFQIEFTRMPPE